MTHPPRPRRAIGLFFKPPVAGKVKTRLAPPLTTGQAARLYAAFLEDSLALCRAVADAELVLFNGGDPGDAVPPTAGSCPILPQTGADLGERMSRAFEALFDGGAGLAVLVGSDAPTLPPERILDAFRALASTDLVLGPADDGGYYLIGLRRRPKNLLSGMAWSTPAVLRETLNRAETLGMTTALLDPWYDVDSAAELERLVDELRAAPVGDPRHRRAPATRRALAALGFLPEKGASG